jgi:hypothetical protein
MKEHHQFHKEANTLFLVWCGFHFCLARNNGNFGYFSYRLGAELQMKTEKTEKKVRDGNRDRIAAKLN